MCIIYDLITLDFLNEHDLEHDLEHKRKFSAPKIFDANGDLKKRWYVYFSYRDPETGKMKRMKNIYGGANRFKTKAERYSVLSLYKKRLLRFLKQGYNPFEDNTELYLKHTQKPAPTTTVKPETKPTATEQPQEHEKEHVSTETPKNEAVSDDKISLKTKHEKPPKPKSPKVLEAFDKALELKTNVTKPKTLEDYKSRIYKLHKWLKKEHKEITHIEHIEKKHIMEFLNEVQLQSSARNRNNYRTVFSSLFQVLEDNDLIESNLIKRIKSLKSKPQRHKTYTDKEQKRIFKYLEKEDPILLLYIKFISYNFLRPQEVCRLKVKDINLDEKTLKFEAKNKVLKTKLIPDLLFDELPDLSKCQPDDLLFTPNKIGGQWDATEINRRTNFSKRFASVKKELGFTQNYTLYSFRHTFITRLYRAMSKDSSPFEAKSRLMLITGHSTMTALEKYLRDIDAELPPDYSDLL
ncbi:tyrosine-type recombinase/integrase [Winogradskyella ouciana]|uniref:Tyrosine-type recombinase/integrase n=1 Tax=Winogradskyella ouciana TaxID=2608631 RepID=A0A7K1GHR0_9FLAO|nr:tyrosine-type recombinase/integrase [Winogradskyella ouciana]MTE27559.1 tyrosine-type recombinase/integrase [Winogradskyella ouciana]